MIAGDVRLIEAASIRLGGDKRRLVRSHADGAPGGAAPALATGLVLVGAG